MQKVNIMIAGSTGYIGIELVKILSKHKGINIKYLCGSTSIGKKISDFDKTIKSKKLPKIIKFNKYLLNKVDIIFTALPNGEAQKISNFLLPHNYLIDLSADFRLKNVKDYLKYYKLKHSSPHNIKNSIYALPEIKKQKIKQYKIISCPGCYPTSVLLPLIPLIKKNLIKSNNIVIDSKSGYSGAGRSVHKKYKNKNLYDSLSAYGVGFHRHNPEIDQELNIISNSNVDFTFTPHLSPMFRGILTTIYVDLKNKSNIYKIHKELKNYYKNSFFIKIMKINNLVSTNNVINTNYCNISLCKLQNKKKLIILSAIDNLIKGGSGQAVQNLNILFNFKQTEGLI